MSEADSGKKGILTYSTAQVRQMFAAHTDWVNQIYDNTDETITQLTPITRPYTVNIVTRDGMPVEHRSAFSPEQRDCIHELMRDINTVIAGEEPQSGLTSYIRSTFRQRLEVGSQTSNIFFEEGEADEMLEEHEQLDRNDFNYALHILERIHAETININPANRYVWNGLINFDNYGIFLLLGSMAKAFSQIGNHGASDVSFDTGFGEELITGEGENVVHLQSRCPFAGFVNKVGNLINAYERAV